MRMAEVHYAATSETAFPLNIGKVVGEGFIKGGGAGSYRVTMEVQAVFKDGKLFTLYPLIK